MQRITYRNLGAVLIIGVLLIISFGISTSNSSGRDNVRQEHAQIYSATKLINEGRNTFRYDTFGDERFWGRQLRLHEAIAGEANGGVGAGISPVTALNLGLKVDITALPKKIRKKIKRGKIDLNDPATTISLLKLNAIIGVKGFFDDSSQLQSVGIQCALCHSQVDDSFAPGIGKRLDGWANRDLNVGAIIAAAPDLTPFASLLGTDQETVRSVLNSWGPGKFDASLLLDGKAFRPDGQSGATLIPPAFGLAGVNLHTWTGWGSVAHWNAMVAVLEMGGQGRFYDPRLNDSSKFPIAAANGFGDIRISPEEDRVTARLPGLHMYQLSIVAPKAPVGTYDKVAARRGEQLFNGKAQCGTCHVPPLYTEPGLNLHKPEEIGIDSFQAERSPDGGYRTAPLKGVWTHSKGGFYHDGRFATLLEVINHYNNFFNLELTENEKVDISEFVSSL